MIAVLVITQFDRPLYGENITCEANHIYVGMCCEVRAEVVVSAQSLGDFKTIDLMDGNVYGVGHIILGHIYAGIADAGVGIGIGGAIAVGHTAARTCEKLARNWSWECMDACSQEDGEGRHSLNQLDWIGILVFEMLWMPS